MPRIDSAKSRIEMGPRRLNITAPDYPPGDQLVRKIAN
jgi:hypothetical protein